MWVFAVLAAVGTASMLVGLVEGLPRWVTWPLGVFRSLAAFFTLTLLLLEVPRLIVLRRRRRRAAPGAAPAPGERPEAVLEPAASTGRRGPGAAVPGAEDGRPAGEGEQAAVPGAPDPRRGPAEPDRRLFLGRSAALIAAVAATGTTVYGVRGALAPPEIRRVPIELARLGSGFHGFRIAAVSDLHIGQYLGRGHTERVVRMINELEPDLIAVVGDLASGTVAHLGRDAEPLRDLHAPFGSFYVTGNHEFAYNAGEWSIEVERLGIRALRNERAELTRAGSTLDLAGVDDVFAWEIPGLRGPDFDAALGGRDESRPVVLLAHQPLQAEEASKHGVDLQISGHTHGGQVAGLGYLAALSQPVVAGLGAVGGTRVYVTSGAGFSNIPVRIGVPPEISLLELRSPA
ncbi:metallophosphoesterase [Rhizohabitans arisaemae]|uniref:metallophosphoesterase n=1 Tax=Rhizohabitans arisaemae TaxID=2720610 RepID=UPI0024B0A984|nr:metallophosphoesterase [Rhizohabitans arisaemae]